MNREEFLAEVTRRGYPREWLFLVPEPDADRNPEGGGIVIEAPAPRSDGVWRTYKLDRGVTDEARFADESAVYRFVLDTHFAESRAAAGPSTRQEFLERVERLGAKRSWFAFRDSPDDRPGHEGQFVIETFGGQVRVYRLERGRRDERLYDTEAQSWAAALDLLPGGSR